MLTPGVTVIELTFPKAPGVQEYVPPPGLTVAVSVAEEPEQISELFTETVGDGFTVTTAEPLTVPGQAAFETLTKV